MGLEIKFGGKGLKDFERFLSKETMRVMTEEVGKATLKNALIMQAEIRRTILSKEFAPNTKLTQLLKGENFPLKDTGDMVSAIETELKDSFNAFVGFLKQSRSSHGGDLERVVGLLQEGFEFRVTAAQRAFLFAHMPESNRPDASSGPGGTSVVRVRARPFLQKTFESPTMRDKLNRNWEKAVKTALERMNAL